jgi:hypothetical protein
MEYTKKAVMCSYQKIIVAPTGTDRLMKEVDKVGVE